jgi:hypothetical protein
MQRFVGLDVHRDYCYVVSLDAAGQVTGRTGFPLS